MWQRKEIRPQIPIRLEDLRGLFTNVEKGLRCKEVVGLVFPEQESWAPSLLGHSPWMVKGNLSVSNKVKCRGEDAVDVVVMICDHSVFAPMGIYQLTFEGTKSLSILTHIV